VNAIAMAGVVKSYGSKRALDGLSFDIPKGVVCAVIGPNGSGKTTTFGILAGLLRYEAGSVSLFGEGAFDARRHAGRVSLMPQDSAPSPHTKLVELLRYYGTLQGLSAAEASREASAWLERVQLGDRASARIGQLSHGMRRRFSVAQALLGKPELILLDEPTSGLDPEVAVEIRQLIAEQRGRATVLVSSHVLSELEELCDHAVILQAGRVVRHGSMASITRANTLVRVTLARAPELEALRAALAGATLSWQAPHLLVQSADTSTVQAMNAVLLRALLDQGAGILEVQAGESLEATYLATRRA